MESDLNSGDALKYYNENKRKRPFSYLIVELDNDCINILEKLYVNNYEVSEWEGYFLSEWNKHPENSYITTVNFFKSLNITNVPIISMYFNPYKGKITISRYIEFICVFTFFTPLQLLPLLLSISDVKNNKIIKIEEIKKFLRILNVPPDLSTQILTMAKRDKHMKRNDTITLSSFYSIIIQNLTIFDPLFTLKEHLINKIIQNDFYSKIIKRKLYYNSLPPHSKPPREDCLEYITRSLFSKDPPPFYYDYEPYVRNELPDDMLYRIRCRFGYSHLNNKITTANSMDTYNNVGKSVSDTDISTHTAGKLKKKYFSQYKLHVTQSCDCSPMTIKQNSQTSVNNIMRRKCAEISVNKIAPIEFSVAEVED